MLKAEEFARAAVPKGLALLVLTGEESFLRDEAFERYRKATDAAAEVVTVSGVGDGKTFDLAGFLDELRTRDLFGGTKLIRLVPADDVVAEHGKVLMQFFESGEAVHPCVIEGDALVGKSSKDGPKIGFLGYVERGGGLIVKCGPVYDTVFAGKGPAWSSPLTHWVRDRAEKHGKKLAAQDAYLLHRLVGTSLRELDSELAKLALAVGKKSDINSDDIERLAMNGRMAGLFQLADVIVNGQLSPALEEVERLYERGFEDQAGKVVRESTSITMTLLGTITSRLRKIGLALEVLASGGSFEEAAAAVRQPPFAYDRLRQDVEFFRRRGDLPVLIRGLRRIERSAKSGGPDPRLLLERWLVRAFGAIGAEKGTLPWRR